MDLVRTPIINALIDILHAQYDEALANVITKEQLVKMLTNYKSVHTLRANLKGRDEVLATWHTNGTTNSGETCTTVMNTIHSIVYMRLIADKAALNVVGYP